MTKIKKMSRSILEIIIYIIRHLYDYNISNKIKLLYNNVYSIWIQYEFKEKNDFFISSPCFIKGGKYIKIGNKSGFGKNCTITAIDNYNGNELYVPQINIGENCWFGEYNHITAINNIQIGNNVLTGRWVTITDNSHGKSNIQSLKISPIERNLYSKGKIIIEDNVWICDKVTILPNVHIGKGAIIAANAVVTRDIPEYSIAAGNPAKIININKQDICQNQD